MFAAYVKPSVVMPTPMKFDFNVSRLLSVIPSLVSYITFLKSEFILLKKQYIGIGGRFGQ